MPGRCRPAPSAGRSTRNTFYDKNARSINPSFLDYRDGRSRSRPAGMLDTPIIIEGSRTQSTRKAWRGLAKSRSCPARRPAQRDPQRAGILLSTTCPSPPPRILAALEGQKAAAE